MTSSLGLCEREDLVHWDEGVSEERSLKTAGWCEAFGENSVLTCGAWCWAKAVGVCLNREKICYSRAERNEIACVCSYRGWPWAFGNLALVSISSPPFPGSHRHIAGTAGGSISAALIRGLVFNSTLRTVDFPWTAELWMHDQGQASFLLLALPWGSLASDKGKLLSECLIEKFVPVVHRALWVVGESSGNGQGTSGRCGLQQERLHGKGDPFRPSWLGTYKCLTRGRCQKYREVGSIVNVIFELLIP